jgi:anti-sigma factor RsiW
MKPVCTFPAELLDRYFDREATADERVRVEEHLPACPACGELLREMGSLQALLKSSLEKETATAEETGQMWTRIASEIRRKERRASWRPDWSWLRWRPLTLRNAWIPGLAAAALALIVLVPFLLQSPSTPAGSVVEYVESQTHNVMVYEFEKTKVTVIWLLDGSEQEKPTS